MPLDINGYNGVFKSFVAFAQERFEANQTKATDEVHKWLRTNDEYLVNDRTRNLFRKAIADMFGGESNIPASVKEAMLLSDYNAGKPLTAPASSR